MNRGFVVVDRFTFITHDYNVFCPPLSELTTTQTPTSYYRPASNACSKLSTASHTKPELGQGPVEMQRDRTGK